MLDRIGGPDDLRGLEDSALCSLADELRQATIDAVSQTGGHLGAGLGVVELTLAIHAVFDTPRDKLIWDVSHQCYPHKILTGRAGRMDSLRRKDGLSGFTKRSESAFDPFGAAHSSTSLSAGLGFAVARDLGGDQGDVICVIGDGAMSAGMAFEGLNNIGAEGRRLFVVLNDNQMSIAPPVGALSRYLSRLGSERAGRPFEAVEGEGSPTFFDELGIDYVGPVDGHNLRHLLAVLRSARASARGPVLIHALTRKGAGYAPAEAAACRYHGVSAFDARTGEQRKAKGGPPSYTKVFGEALVREALRDPSITAVTAAMPDGTGVDIFGKRFPERAFDVGIAEQHAVTFCAGQAAGGLRPFCAIYSTFLQRGYDQVVHDVALQNLPVRFAIDRAGLVGADGATHAGAFDLGYLTALPNMTVMAAADEAELARMVATAARHDDGPIAFRYPRGAGTGIAVPEAPEPLEIGRGRVLREGADAAILSLGGRLGEALAAADALAAEGIAATVADARFAKPLDLDLLRSLVDRHTALVTVEEGAAGGFGAQVLHALAVEGRLDGRCAVRCLTLPDRFIDQASPQEMYEEAGLCAADLARTVKQALSGGGRHAAALEQ